MAEATLKQVFDYFKVPGYTLTDFKNDWQGLTDTDREHLKSGIGNGTETY